MLDTAERHDAASLLWLAERHSRPIEPLVNIYPAMEVVDAYEIQLLNIRRKLADGAAICGHKVGLSSRAMQQMMGVHEPDYGHSLTDMALEDGEAVSLSGFCYPRIEVEVAFVLGRGLPGEDCTCTDVLDATEYVAPAMELIDSRIHEWRIGIADTIADNASTARFVLGSQRHSPADIDLADIDAVLYCGQPGREVEMTRGNSRAVLGNPIAAVAWLARKLANFGGRLEAGHTVLPGSCTKAVDVVPGDRFLAEFAGPGTVSIEFR